MDPIQFRLDWDVLAELLVTITVLAFFVERALSLVFESKVFIRSKLDDNGTKEILTLARAYAYPLERIKKTKGVNMQPHRITQVVIATLVLAGSAALAATSQDDVDEAKRVQQLEEAKKAAAQARQATAEAQAAEAKAKLGTIDASKFTPPKGEAKTLALEGSLLAYSALDGVATKIAEAVKPAASAAGGLSRPVALLGDKEFNALQQAKSFKSSLAVLNNNIKQFKVPKLAADDPQCKEPTEAGGGLGVLGSIDVALQIAQLFKVDKSLEGAEVSIDEFALASVVVSKLQAAGFKQVAYGPVFLAGAFGGKDPFADSDIVKALDTLTGQQLNIDIALAEIARRRDKLKDREDDKKVKLPDACKIPFDEARAIYTSLETRGKNLKDRADKFSIAVTTLDDKTGVTVLQALVQGETMSKNLVGARVLRLKPISGGGTVYIKTNLFATHIGIGGGAIVAYMLLDGTDGSVMASGTSSVYGGFVEPEKLSGILNK